MAAVTDADASTEAVTRPAPMSALVTEHFALQSDHLTLNPHRHYETKGRHP